MELIDCPECGRLNGPGTSLCVECGIFLNNYPVESQGRSTHRQEDLREPPKQVPNNLRVGAEIGCVALLIISSFVGWRNASQLGKVQELLSASEEALSVIENQLNDLTLASDRSKFRVNELSNTIEDLTGDMSRTMSTEKEIASLSRELQEIKETVDRTDGSLYSISNRLGRLEYEKRSQKSPPKSSSETIEKRDGIDDYLENIGIGNAGISIETKDKFSRWLTGECGYPLVTGTNCRKSADTIVLHTIDDSFYYFNVYTTCSFHHRTKSTQASDTEIGLFEYYEVTPSFYEAQSPELRASIDEGLNRK